MHAKPGDMIVVQGRHIGEHERHGEIVEVRGPNGEPPYVVRWDDSGHTTLFFPSSDALVRPLGADQEVMTT